MTKDKALYTYFNAFMTAYPSTSVPDTVTFPFMTYDVILGSFKDEETMPEIDLWYRCESEAVPNAKAEELRQYIDENPLIKCDTGYIWIKPGSPWCQSLTDEVDPSIKRRYINVVFEYLAK